MVDGEVFLANTPDVQSSVFTLNLHRKLSINVSWLLVNHVGTVILG